MKNLELKCWGIFLVFLLVLASPFLLSGCKTLPPASETTEVKVTETLRDTVFTEVPDSSSIKALIECQNNKPVIKQIIQAKSGKRIRPPSLTLKADNILQCDCKADSLKFIAFWKDKYRELSSVKQKPVLVEKKLTWWQETWIALGKILTAATLIIISYKLFKNRLKIT